MKILHLAPIKIAANAGVDLGSRVQPEGISFSVPSLASAQISNGNETMRKQMRADKTLSNA